MLRRLGLSLTLLGLLAAGCHQPAQPTQPTATEVVVSDVDEFDLLWRTAVRALERHQFQVDRQDRHAGIITTFPETAPQWFEFWRRDFSDPYSTLESSLHTIRRQATVRVVRTEGEKRYRVEVEVRVSRWSAPERQVTTASGAMRMFSREMPTTEGLMPEEAEPPHWVDLGRDPVLEKKLLQAILDLYAPPAPAFEQPERPS